MSHDLPKVYDPAAIEERWAAYWVTERLFDQPVPPEHAAKPFTMLLPPPNVTGRLHMGHMFEQAETDILVRWHRMLGDTALWVPGTDHAGIATQMMVEKQLADEGTSRQALGREGFVERVWQWREVYGGAILDQMKRLGASVDWSREYFTMDEKLSVAVKEAFVRLWNQGLIYRGNYIVNWDPVQRTAVSDLEVTHEDRIGKLYHVRYPLADGSGSTVIATTRPETMLGDTAVAVNPEDARYLALQGKLLRLPLSGVTGGADREIPVIADSWANPEFGTGAVKVTPAHDPNDYAIGERHGLPKLTIMDAEARIDLPGSPYHGLDRYVARERIVSDLDTLGLLVDVKDHPMSIGLSQRTGAVIEPRLSTQWFLRTADFRDEHGELRHGIAHFAREAVAPSDGSEPAIRITPDQHRKVYIEWMENIHDWCISRQLWWGHRIPAWHCAGCGNISVVTERLTACPHCGCAEIHQDTDVLDTWFSSGLLPFTVFGWPAQTADLAAFYPTQLLVTGFDILFFWVARMIMLGTHFMLAEPMPDGSSRTLAEAVPFREVYIHALVRDADKQKMSKTKGNVIDPIEIVKQYGTDAVRFTLAAMASPGTDIAFSEGRTEGYRAFANKIWNAARFIFMNIDRAAAVGIVVDLRTLTSVSVDQESTVFANRWITSRLNGTVAAVDEALVNYRFHEAANVVYQFFWGDFCDWYLEWQKPRLNFAATVTVETKLQAYEALAQLIVTFDASLRLLSPFMPFLTEELWFALYGDAPPSKSIALCPFPSGGLIDLRAEWQMEAIRTLVLSITACRKSLQIRDSERVPIKLRALERNCSDELLGVVNSEWPFIQGRARVTEYSIFDASDGLVNEASNSSSFFEVRIRGNSIDGPTEVARLNREITRLIKEIAKLEASLNSARSSLSDEAYLQKARSDVIEGRRLQESRDATSLEAKQSEVQAKQQELKMYEELE